MAEKAAGVLFLKAYADVNTQGIYLWNGIKQWGREEWRKMDAQSEQLPSYNRAAVSQFFSILFLGEGCDDQSFGGPGKVRQERETVETGLASRAEERCDKEESLQGT